MKKLSLILFVLLVSTIVALSQKTVTGKVADSAGDPLIGANVLVQGTDVGTVTDLDGMFSLNVPKGNNSIVISYIGFTEQVIDVSTTSDVNVTLQEGQLLDEVVVTALGVERNARNVAYSNQTVSAEELLSAPNKNALEALRGKTAGVKISTGSGSVGASTRIVLRGESSLTGNNNALIVIDGVPIDNDASRGGNGAATTGYADYGNRFNDINPEDIASVTILKGPAATSVYGSRGASGVVVVTTKKGNETKDKFSVGVNTTYSMDEAYIQLQRQDKFGQGFSGNTFDSGENFSWGPALDGVVRPWTSPVDTDGDGTVEFLSRPYSAVPDQLQHFFRRGFTSQSNISFSGSSDKFSYYSSIGNANQKGTLDNTDYKRNSVNFSASAKLSSKFKTDFSINYSLVNINGAQEGSRGFDGNNAYAAAIQTPVNIPFQELRDYNSPFNDFKGWYGSYTGNPYFTLNETQNKGRINNLLGSVSLTYNLAKGLDIVGRAGTNLITREITSVTPKFEYLTQQIWTNNLALVERHTAPLNAGELVEDRGNNNNLNVTGQVNYSRDLSSKIKLSSSVGYDLFERRTKTVSGQTIGGFVVPGWYNLSNSVQQAKSTQRSSNYRINGVYGNANLGYDNWLFLDYSARNDWSSTLPSTQNSFFYQAVGVSAIITDVLNMQDNSTLSYLKLRGSIGTTGKDAALYSLQSSFEGNPVLQALGNNHDLLFPLNGQSGFTLGNTIGNPDLRPELTTTTELGTDISLFNDLLAIEYTYYNANHSDQIVTINLPSSTGFTQTTKNIGKINNKGHELGVTIRPLGKSSKIKWELGFNYSQNRNKVIKISDQQDELSIGAYPVNIVAKEGLPFGTFKGTVIDQTPDGRTIVDGVGNPVLATDEQYLGSYQPDFLAGLTNSISYKGFTFGFLLDAKKGGKFYSYTKSLSEFNGTASTTLLNNREPYIIPGVVKNADGSFSNNTSAISVYDYLLNLPDSKHVVDASYLKLRDVTLTYKFGKSIASKLKASELTLGIFGRNLKYWLPAENSFADPEVNGNSLTGNAVGIETTQIPTSRSVGVNLSVRF